MRMASLFIGLVAVLSGPLVQADPPIPAPQEVDYAGVIELEVDATDLEHRIFHVHERLPAQGGAALTLLYPKWLPGNHSTTGPIDQLAGLIITDAANGKRIEWRRDTENMHAFHVDIPQDARLLDVRFDFLTPAGSAAGRRVMTTEMLGLQWEKALLYPAGHYARHIRIKPTLQLPTGWQYATALEGGQREGDTVRFAAVDLETLVDSPLFAGRHYRRYELDTDPSGPVRLNVFADRASELEATPEQLHAHRRLVQEMRALFGARHYRHYDFLLAISADFGGIGLEHHQSSENGVDLGYFSDWGGTASGRDLLAHEYEHSWNGKFRRPADLWTPSYEVPMHNSLLWVYEGMTEFWGIVVGTRAGLWSQEFARDALASYAANLDANRAGREWRNLQDTVNQPIIGYRSGQSFPSWQRGVDYYSEGALIWLEADGAIRAASQGRRSIDDFARGFFGIQDGFLGPVTYTFDDVVRGLNDVAPMDWRDFLRTRVDGHGPGAPLGGLERSGWRLVYRNEPNAYTKEVDGTATQTNLLYSLGLAVGNGDQKIAGVAWGSPAFKAGLAPGMTLLAVNGYATSAQRLKEAVTDAQTSGTPIELLVRDYDRFRTVRIDYRGGLRYPHLERLEGRIDSLSMLLAPRVSKPLQTSDKIKPARAPATSSSR